MKANATGQFPGSAKTRDDAALRFDLSEACIFTGIWSSADFRAAIAENAEAAARRESIEEIRRGESRRVCPGIYGFVPRERIMIEGLLSRALSTALAFVALCSLLAVRPSTARAGSEEPALSQHDAVIHGVKIHYLRAGSGDPVVLVHGYPESSRTWRRVLPVLAQHYTVIAPDTRGTGESAITADFQLRDAAEDIYGLVHQLGFRRVFLVGHDFGVQVVSAYAALHRDEVRGLVVAESPLSAYGLEALYPKFWHFGFLASPFAPMLIGNNVDPFFRKFAFSEFVYQKAAFSKAEIDDYIAAEVHRSPGELTV